MAREPEGSAFLGAQAARLMRAYDVALDPWQERVLGGWLACDPGGAPPSVCGLSVPRQNGKTALLEARELFGMVCMDPPEHILHTAHEVKTARKAFTRLASMFEDDRAHPDLARLVKEVRRTNGQERITLTNHASIEYSARSRGAARGYTVDVVVFDEAQELTDEQIEAMIPTLSAAPSGRRQFVYAGTPPPPGSPGEVFARERANALAGGDPGVCWHEWGVVALPPEGAAFEDVRELCYETNPAIGYRIDVDFCAREFTSMSRAGFARERLGWWSPSGRADRAVDPAAWAACATDEPRTEGRVGVGVKLSPDGGRVCVACCRFGGDAPAYVELVFDEPTARGLGWLSRWLVEGRAGFSALLMDGMGSADLAQRLESARFPRRAVMRGGSRAVADAAAAFVAAVNEGSVRHWSDAGQAALDDAAALAVKRQLAGGYAFGGAECTPLEAASLAFWAARNARMDPGRRGGAA